MYELWWMDTMAVVGTYEDELDAMRAVRRIRRIYYNEPPTMLLIFNTEEDGPTKISSEERLLDRAERLLNHESAVALKREARTRRTTDTEPGTGGEDARSTTTVSLAESATGVQRRNVPRGYGRGKGDSHGPIL